MTLQEALQQITQEYTSIQSTEKQTIQAIQNVVKNSSHALIPMRLKELIRSVPCGLACFFNIDPSGTIALKSEFNQSKFIVPILNATLTIPSQETAWRTLWQFNAFDSILELIQDSSANRFNRTIQPYIQQKYNSTTTLPIQGELFTMGALPNDDLAWDDEKGGVALPMPFNIEVRQFLVTQLEWLMIMQEQPSSTKGFVHPVEGISWFDALLFCNRLSKIQDLEPVYILPKANIINSDPTKAHQMTKQNLHANGWRLPLEIEWEFAARAGQHFLFSGSSNMDEVGWYGSREWINSKWQEVGNSNCDTTQPVGLKRPNDFGLYDMSGNVWEWCWNVFGALPQSTDEFTSYRNQKSPNRTKGYSMIKKGGAWRYVPKSCRISNRGFQPSKTTSNYTMGMRLFRTI